MAVDFEDGFGGATNDDLVVEGPDTTGTGYTLEESSSSHTLRHNGSGSVEPNTNSTGDHMFYTGQPDPTDTLYDIELTNSAIIGGEGSPDNDYDNRGAIGRFADTSNYYWAGMVVGNYEIHKEVGGSKTQLASVAGDSDFNTTTVMLVKFRITGTTIELLSNGVSKVTTTDTAFTDADKYGLYFGDPEGNGGYHDNSEVTLFKITGQGGGLSSEQEGFRFRNDDGSESAATWKADQDTDISLGKEVACRLRTLVDMTGDPPTQQATLQYRKVGDPATEWRTIV